MTVHFTFRSLLFSCMFQRLSSDAGLMLVQRLRRCPNIKPALNECLVIAGFTDDRTEVEHSVWVNTSLEALEWLRNNPDSYEDARRWFQYAKENEVIRHESRPSVGLILKMPKYFHTSQETRDFSQFEVIINVLVSSFRYIQIPTLWVYGNYKYLKLLSVQGSTLDVRISRSPRFIKTI